MLNPPQKAMGIPGIISCQNVALRTPLMFDPGNRWDYGINIDWAGKMVEAVSDKRLGEYLQENLFSPLGMNSTAFKITPEMRARLAKIHQRGADGAFTPTDIEIPQEPEFEMGGGGALLDRRRLPEVRASTAARATATRCSNPRRWTSCRATQWAKSRSRCSRRRSRR